MKRSLITRLARVVLALTATLVSMAGGAAAQAAPPARPNIIFILADDLGYGDLGSYGQKQIRTPRLDEMARNGMRFTQHYAGGPVCAPSRSVLMTGMHMGHTTVRGNFGRSAAGENERIPLRPADLTVAELLKGAGYTTGMIGKWGLGEPGTTGVPDEQGFDYFLGYLNQARAHEYYTDYVWRNEEKMPLPGNANGRKTQYSHDIFADSTLAFLERNRDRPFFLYLPYTLPHALMEVPRDSVLAGYEKRFPEKEATFAAMVTRLDRDVGRILDKLRELGIDRNTIVIFAGDNGPHKEDGHDANFFDSNGPLRGIKRDMYEGGIRIPMLAFWPGRIRPGSVTDHISGFQDFLATAAEVAGVPAPATDGISYLPVLTGREQPAHPYLYWEFYEGGPAQAVRMGRWKAIRRPGFTGPFELYDLQSDLGEQHDVAAAHPDLIRQITSIMEREHVASPYWGPPAAPAR
jgi:arylsulfatase A-like enzyme